MATSDSDDFESADEEVEFRVSSPRKCQTKWAPQSQHSSAIDSDTDDDNDCITSIKGTSWSSEISDKNCTNKTSVSNKLSTLNEEIQIAIKSTEHSAQIHNTNNLIQIESNELVDNQVEKSSECNLSLDNTESNDNIKMECNVNDEIVAYGDEKSSSNIKMTDNKLDMRRNQRIQRQQKQKESHKPLKFGAKKLGVKITSEIPTQSSSEISKNTNIETSVPMCVNKEPSIIQECWEFDDDEATKILQRESLKSNDNSWHKKKSNKLSDGNDEYINDNIPEELKSDKKFKEVFNNNRFIGFVDEDKIINDFDNEKTASTIPIVKTPSDDETNSGGTWSSWSSWGVTSLLNSASVGVSTLTSHVTHGLTLLEESIGAPDPAQLVQSTDEIEATDDKSTRDSQAGSFGFSNIISGVSSITKLVESTSTKVISGGLGTLETIGKKTMEVLQEGDPGLKKKRAFFMNEMDKPILSQMLREAKEKAEMDEKNVEEKQQLRKIHFETLFDDFQGLVHLEALEMLSKQSNMKIQQRLVTLGVDEMISIQETLDEVKELCDLGDDDDYEESDKDDLNEKLKSACADLGVEITYEKLYELWDQTKLYISNAESSSSISNKEIFQNAISSLAQFTAYCVERFHKTAELLLIKERRSTVYEADALVQLAKILSGQIGIVANLFSNCLNERIKKMENTNDKVDITTIFLEASNASSYIQDAFRLLIPILQVGAI